VEQGEYGKALEEADKAVSLDPGNLNAYMTLGNIYRHNKEHEKSLVEYKKVLGLVKDDKKVESEICREIAQVYVEQGEYGKALEEADKAVSLDPGNLNAYMTLGNIYRHNKEHEKSLVKYKKVLELAKGDKKVESEIYGEIAQVYVEQGEYDKALEEADKAARLDSGNLKAYMTLGSIYRHNKEYEKALVEYKKILELAKGYKKIEKEVYESMVKIYSEIGEYSRIVEAINRLIEIGYSNVSNYLMLSVAFKMQGCSEESEKAFDTAMDMIKAEKKLKIMATGISVNKNKKEENKALNEDENS